MGARGDRSCGATEGDLCIAGLPCGKAPDRSQLGSSADEASVLELMYASRTEGYDLMPRCRVVDPTSREGVYHGRCSATATTCRPDW